MKNFICLFVSMAIIVLCCFSFVSCKEKQTEVEVPKNLTLTEPDEGENKEIQLKVYDVESKKILTMGLEEYLEGVLAGEMTNTWHIEALKAQAILARTYTLYYLKNLSSKYEGADISNDVTEAQAYDSSRVNENIKRAVKETAGMVVLCDGEPIQAWFHANSGGVTTKAKTGLEFKDNENYTKSVASPEKEANSKNFSWNVTFSKAEVLSALRQMGVEVSTIRELKVGQVDESGRAVTLKIGDSEFSAPTFRIKIGSTKMKSTKIEEIIVSSNSISLSGTGYGHGVGMSQWGAKLLAEQGKTAEEIIRYYFDNIEVVKANYKN